ncbi:GNAT family N-acetyltransferase [Lysinibacillus sp. KU-BSD001]|uniref:GNAT family N-acetyltransferase n=1 Tax=Lysinibacillus sp. KU-BSD001 TaxID=3141328 RepID=UPI0036E3FB3C
MRFEVINISDVNELAKLYVETFNAPPWNDEWSMDTASKRLSQMINGQEFYGLKAYEEETLCGMIMGNEEQYYNGKLFHIIEFCVKNDLQHKGLGTKILHEFESRLIRRGIREIILFTSREDRTEGYYHKRGFQSYNSMVMMGKNIN